MPIEKFRDVADMGPVRRIDPTDPDFVERVSGLWKASLLMSGYTPPRGVQKFRSLEEADAERTTRMFARMRRRALELGLIDGDGDTR